MVYALLDEQLFISDDIESRREHERYDCAGVKVSYASFTSSYLNAVNSPLAVGVLKDISMTGLCIDVDNSLTVGETISLKLSAVDNLNIEELDAEIMWCQLKDHGHYRVGLKVIQEENLKFDFEDELSEATTADRHYLVCPSCDETSFYIKTSNNTERHPSLHTCCRCNNSHVIAEVIAFNRQ